jgi:hypothetical protein
MAGQLTLEPLKPAKEMERFLSFVYRPGALIEIRTSMPNIKDKVQTVGGPFSGLSLRPHVRCPSTAVRALISIESDPP